MYIPKKNRFEMFLKRSSTPSSKSNNINISSSSSSNTYNWSEACTEFIKDVVLLRRRLSITSNNKGKIDNSTNDSLISDPNLCLDQLSEFQKSYVSFPEFSHASTISNDSEVTSSNASGVQIGGGNYWITSSSSYSTTISSL